MFFASFVFVSLSSGSILPQCIDIFCICFHFLFSLLCNILHKYPSRRGCLVRLSRSGDMAATITVAINHSNPPPANTNKLKNHNNVIFLSSQSPRPGPSPTTINYLRCKLVQVMDLYGDMYGLGPIKLNLVDIWAKFRWNLGPVVNLRENGWRWW